MAPTASMLFLSYHQLHRPAAAAEAAPPSCREVDNGAAGGRVRLSLSGALSIFARRSEAAPAPATAKAGTGADQGERRIGGAGQGELEPEASSLERRFEEALRLSCWSS